MSKENNPLMTPQTPNPNELIPGQKPPSAIDASLELKLISHSQFFYYWPVWFISLVFAGITAWKGKEITIPDAEHLKIVIIDTPSLGLAYLIVLITVILFTSINIRGVWAALVAAAAICIGLLFSLLKIWEPILRAIGNVNFFLNREFYFFMGIVLLIFWVLVVFLYDRRHYLVFRPTQFTVVEEIGAGEKNYDTFGLSFDKKRDNFFQHWLLGFGSGDLRITTSGAQRHEIEFPNVLFIGKNLKKIHQIREDRGRGPLQ